MCYYRWANYLHMHQIGDAMESQLLRPANASVFANATAGNNSTELQEQQPIGVIHSYSFGGCRARHYVLGKSSELQRCAWHHAPDPKPKRTRLVSQICNEQCLMSNGLWDVEVEAP